MKISFVIPVYIVEEKLFVELINSFNQQKFFNLFECIFVIDEVNPITDYDKIINNLNGKITRKIIYNDKNLGSGNSRNIGINNSCGEYIAFVDSDDRISANYISVVMPIIEKLNCDIIRLNYTKNTTDTSVIKFEDYKQIKNTLIPGWASYTMILKRSFLNLNKIRFLKNTSYGEDIYLFLMVMCNTDFWYEINDQLYYYNRNVSNSLTLKMHKNYIKSAITVKNIIKMAKSDMDSKEQFKKYKFYKKYIWWRIFKNLILNVFSINQHNS